MKNIILTILFTTIFHGHLHAADDPAIPVKPHAWLESLSKNYQRIALIFYQIALGEKFGNVLASAKNEKDRMWGIKIFTCGHLFAAQSATKNDDQREALAAITAALRDGLSGKGDPDSQKKKLRTAELMGERIASSIPDSAANRFQEKYATESKRFNRDFIIAAMECASDSGTPKQANTCHPKGIDVCKMARKISDETAPTLPIQLNKNLSIHTISAAANLITMVAKLEYNKKSLDLSLSNSGISQNAMLSTMSTYASGTLCTINSPTKKFIDSGGFINYHYKFIDGSTYTNVQITSCP